jgi:hypothetical protein
MDRKNLSVNIRGCNEEGLGGIISWLDEIMSMVAWFFLKWNRLPV